MKLNFKTWILSGFAVIGVCALVGKTLDANDGDRRDVLQRLIKLYHYKVVAAEMELKSDLATLKFWERRLARHKHLLQTSSIAEATQEDSQLSYEHAAIEVEADENAVEEAKTQFSLIEEGVRRGDIDLNDLVIGTDLRMKRK